ncbi:hypothetical protein PSHT_15401, partial [Puccinia striiformis]
SGPTSDSNQPQLAPNPDLNTPEAAPNPDLNLLQPRSNPDLNPDRGLTQPPTRSQPAILPPSLVQDTLQQSNLNEAELFVANMSTPSSHSDPRHALKILQEIRELQKQHDEESKKLGSYFVTFAGTTRN